MTIRYLNLVDPPLFYAEDQNGNPAADYLVYTMLAGTVDTPVTTYQDRTGLVENTNPIKLDVNGQCIIYSAELLHIFLCAPGNTPADSIYDVDFVGEPSSNYVTGTIAAATTNNNYVVTGSPAITTLVPGLTLNFNPDVTNNDTIVSTVFTGTGINDMVASGPYSGTTNKVFTFQIDSLNDPDTFKWTDDGGTTWHTGIPITAESQIILEGLAVQFSVTTGHVLSDIWAVTVTPAVRINLDGTGNFLGYKNKGGSIVLLDGGDMVEDYPSLWVINQSLNGYLLMNPATPTFSTPTITANRYRKRLTDNYTLTISDQGYYLTFETSTNKTLTLLTPPQFSGKFFYVKNDGTAVVTVYAGDEYVIKGQNTSRYYLGPGGTIQLVSDGVEWTILTTVSIYNLYQVVPMTTSSQTISGFLPGVEYRLVLDMVPPDSRNLAMTFNADSGSNYTNREVISGGVGVTTYIPLTYTSYGVVNTYISGEIVFRTWVGNDHNVDVRSFSQFEVRAFDGSNGGFNFLNMYSRYRGSADLSSLTLDWGSGTPSGTILLYTVGT